MFDTEQMYLLANHMIGPNCFSGFYFIFLNETLEFHRKKSQVYISTNRETCEGKCAFSLCET